MTAAKEPMEAVSDSKDYSEGQVFNHSDADIAAAYADKLDGENAYTSAEEKRLRWKLDLRLVPILWLNITLSAMDKVTTSTAALYGMKTATNLTGDRYSWVGSAFYASEFEKHPEPGLTKPSLATSFGVYLRVTFCKSYLLLKPWPRFNLCGASFSLGRDSQRTLRLSLL
jgi:hypothetical protein